MSVHALLFCTSSLHFAQLFFLLLCLPITTADSLSLSLKHKHTHKHKHKCTRKRRILFLFAFNRARIFFFYSSDQKEKCHLPLIILDIHPLGLHSQDSFNPYQWYRTAGKILTFWLVISNRKKMKQMINHISMYEYILHWIILLKCRWVSGRWHVTKNLLDSENTQSLFLFLSFICFYYTIYIYICVCVEGWGGVWVMTLTSPLPPYLIDSDWKWFLKRGKKEK